MPNISIQLKENKGSQKRYVFKVTETPNFLATLFGDKKAVYKVLCMSRSKLPLEEAERLTKLIFHSKDNWKPNKGKKCDHIATLADHPSTTFFITNSICNNESDHTNTKGSEEADKQ
ncbi:hypothetical protein [Aureispira sp. CCB-E]|uniref:hypothetical protein n=1 Tax=Aureispira sp. CCB-E TaxID=3051121 RepID=UPI0028689F99|nr:hypothetical protein [Aureispira sp. CCB-E]WMX17469.1 hypothetical protein QP953_13895 [Aureispira sp. CCB-E]